MTLAPPNKSESSGATDEQETARRRDNALRRALTTPPNPKTSGKEDKSQDEKGKPGD
ncbi:hypothetical protein GCM10011499_26180 [Pelagibacterium lentulum]|uniref:Uncharacterized protein n=1 Tax=Pelagibacterium lentulum TaxID=2029865 RepID=A0A916RHT8_9HYPH|nr:hypothetical protein GCM10011499_26180 [Pelagibacterium lentulum]